MRIHEAAIAAIGCTLGMLVGEWIGWAAYWVLFGE